MRGIRMGNGRMAGETAGSPGPATKNTRAPRTSQLKSSGGILTDKICSAAATGKPGNFRRKLRVTQSKRKIANGSPLGRVSQFEGVCSGGEGAGGNSKGAGVSGRRRAQAEAKGAAAEINRAAKATSASR